PVPTPCRALRKRDRRDRRGKRLSDGPYLRSLIRIAVLFRKRPYEVMAWDRREIDLVSEFLIVEPTQEAKIEYAIAQLTEFFYAANFKRSNKSLSDFILF